MTHKGSAPGDGGSWPTEHGPENRLFVGAGPGDSITIVAWGRMLHRLDALNLAAWIVAIADEGEFDELLKQVRST